MLIFKYFIVFITIIIFCGYSFSQPDWVREYNGTGNAADKPYFIGYDLLGNIYVTGESRGVNSNTDIVTVSYTENGTERWVSRYNGAGNGVDIPYAMKIGGAMNVYITGFIIGTSGFQDIITLKYSSTGELQWAAIYDGAAHYGDQGYSIDIDNDENIYVTGITSISDFTFDIVTIKYNSAGVMQWSDVWSSGLGLNDVGNAIKFASVSNRIYVAGYRTTSSQGLDYVTLQYDTNGWNQWACFYDGPVDSNDMAVGLATDGYFAYVTGYSYGGFLSKNDWATIMYGADGTELWAKRYNGTSNNVDYAKFIAIDDSDNVYVAGTAYLGEPATQNIVVIKYDDWGIQEWISSFDGLLDNGVSLSGMYYYPWGRRILVTGTGSFFEYGADIVTCLYSSGTGSILWYDEYLLENVQNGYAVTAYWPYIFVTGYGWVSGQNYNFITMRYHVTALPVSLVNFTSLTDARDVTLNWSTSEEVNNHGFDIERQTLREFEVCSR